MMTRMNWGANGAKRGTSQGRAIYRAVKKAARRLDAKIAQEGN